jgi:hypothetical protein
VLDALIVKLGDPSEARTLLFADDLDCDIITDAVLFEYPFGRYRRTRQISSAAMEPWSTSVTEQLLYTA